ncbi:MAG: ABC transporter permease [Bacteroidales bacterium]|nr:ABC transporter permease [Bacteroidales bacterium]
MNTAFRISRRLRLGSGGGSPAAVVIAVVGVALSVMIMEFTLAIVVGFKSGIVAKLAGFDAQISVGAPYSANEALSLPFVTRSETLDSILRLNLPADADVRLAIRQPGMLKTTDDFEGVVFIGQSADAPFTFEKANIVEGEWPVYSSDSCDNQIVISRQLANALKLGVGDKVYSTFIIDEDIKLRRHTVAGLYESDFGDYDRSVVYASLRGLQRVVGADSLQGNAIDIRGLNEEDIDPLTQSLQHTLVDAVATRRLSEFCHVGNIHNSGALYYNWLALLDTNVSVIFILMLAVSGFTLISSLFVLILERISTIGILRAMGAPRSMIREIFTDMGLRLVGRGLLIGNVLGIGLLLVQKYTSAIPLDPDMYYLSAVPVEIRPWWFVILNVGIIAVSWLILYIPARSASKVSPSEAIDYD